MKSLLSPVQYESLLHLNKFNKGLCVREISKGINRTYSSVGVKIRGLERMGLIKCEKNSKNKKKVIVTLLPKGEEVVALLYKITELLPLKYITSV